MARAAFERLRLEVEADPPVFAAHTWRFDRLGGFADAGVRERDLHLNAAYLQQLSEAVRASVVFRASEDREGAPVLAERRFPIEILARSEWGGGIAQPELLAAFVMPNDSAINRILKRASEVLARAGKRDALDGYQAGSRTRAYELASAIWSAVAGLKLTYAEPPASFETQGQKVRTPSALVEAGLAPVSTSRCSSPALSNSLASIPCWCSPKGTPSPACGCSRRSLRRCSSRTPLCCASGWRCRN